MSAARFEAKPVRRVVVEVRQLTCGTCGHLLAAEHVAFQLLVERRARGEGAALMRCRACEVMNTLELVDGRAVARVDVRSEEAHG